MFQILNLIDFNITLITFSRYFLKHNHGYAKCNKVHKYKVLKICFLIKVQNQFQYCKYYS